MSARCPAAGLSPIPANIDLLQHSLSTTDRQRRGRCPRACHHHQQRQHTVQRTIHQYQQHRICEHRPAPTDKQTSVSLSTGLSTTNSNVSTLSADYPPNTRNIDLLSTGLSTTDSNVGSICPRACPLTPAIRLTDDRSVAHQSGQLASTGIETAAIGIGAPSDPSASSRRRSNRRHRA